MREITEIQLRKLKAETHFALKMAGGPDSFQHITRVNQGQLSKYASKGDEHAASFMPIDIAVECDMAAGRPVILAAMAALVGYRLVKGEGAAPAVTVTDRDVSGLMLEAADVQRAWHAATADNHVDRHEAAQMRKELHEVVRSALALIEKLGD